MRLLGIVILFFSLILLLQSPVQAQQAECDACGYCVGRTAPENWSSCKACLYPDALDDPVSNETLKLARNDQGKMEPVKKRQGAYFTQLGCLDVGADSFSDPTAPGGVLNFLLSSLLFPTVGVLAFISLIYGAFLLITAQGVPEQINRGKSYIVGAIVGLLFTLSAILIINILAGDILRIPGFTRSPKGTVRVKATTAIVGGKTVHPILKVSHEGEEIQSVTLGDGTQEIKVDLPFSAEDLGKQEVLGAITFSMKNDACYTMTSKDRALCCDCAQDESAIEEAYRESWRIKCNNRPMPASRINQCRDRVNFHGDVNMYISQININGKRCTGFIVNGAPSTLSVVELSSTGTLVSCGSIEN